MGRGRESRVGRGSIADLGIDADIVRRIVPGAAPASTASAARLTDGKTS
jgi:hypothetical protein